MIGKVSEDVFESLLETMPLDITVLDKNDKVLAWNRHESRIFKRSPAVVGRDVRDCHPRESIDKVEIIIKEMKAMKRDRARFWIDLPVGQDGKKNKILIEYFALRDDRGKYLGCLEASQNIHDLQKLKGEKRLLE